MATIGSLLSRSGALSDVSDTPRLDTEVLLCHVLRCTRTYLLTWPDKPVAPQQREQFLSLLARRLEGEPIAHLVGVREFWSLPLKVSPATLIPRPDTELLVETALARVDRADARVLDLGTGTGAIALALASERPGWQLVAVDCEPEVVALARENSRALGIGNVQVLLSDWFTAVEGGFDLIVANPPYIAADDPHLRRGDLRFEPRTALIAADGGLADLALILAGAKCHLNLGGLLLLEHGAGQGEAVRGLFRRRGYSGVETLRDLAALERATLGYL